MARRNGTRWIPLFINVLYFSAGLVTPALAETPDSREWAPVSLQQLLLMLPGGSGTLGKCTVTIGGDADRFSIEFSGPPSGGKAITRRLEFALVDGDFSGEDSGAPRAPAGDMKFPSPDETDRRHGQIEMRSTSLFTDKTPLRLFFDRSEQRVIGSQVDSDLSCGDL
jgi:hypothetical protein